MSEPETNPPSSAQNEDSWTTLDTNSNGKLDAPEMAKFERESVAEELKAGQLDTPFIHSMQTACGKKDSNVSNWLSKEWNDFWVSYKAAKRPGGPESVTTPSYKEECEIYCDEVEKAREAGILQEPQYEKLSGSCDLPAKKTDKKSPPGPGQ